MGWGCEVNILRVAQSPFQRVESVHQYADFNVNQVDQVISLTVLPRIAQSGLWIHTTYPSNPTPNTQSKVQCATQSSTPTPSRSLIPLYLIQQNPNPSTHIRLSPPPSTSSSTSTCCTTKSIPGRMKSRKSFFLHRSQFLCRYGFGTTYDRWG